MRVLGRKHRWRTEKAPRRSGRRQMRTSASDACFALLESLRTDGATDLVAEQWEALWRREQAAIHARDIRLAGLVLYAGWTVLAGRGEHAGALGLMNLYFRHPHVAKDLPMVRLAHRALLATSLMWCGEAGEAATEYRAFLAASPRGSVAAAVRSVRDDLLTFFEGSHADAPVDADMVELTRTVLARLRRTRAARALPDGPASGAMLAAALATTLPATRPT